jgi:pectate lyase
MGRSIIRFGIDNIIKQQAYCICYRISQILRKSKFSENVDNPIVSFYSNTQGFWDVADKVFENIAWEEKPSNGVIAGPNVGSTIYYKPAYDYSLVPAADAKSYVLNNAGVGKLDGVYERNCAMKNAYAHPRKGR